MKIPVMTAEDYKNLPSLELKDEKLWQQLRETNKSVYGRALIDYVERWARLMQAVIAKDKKLYPSAVEKTSHQADTKNISGAAQAEARLILYRVWRYGDDLYNLAKGHVGVTAK